MFNLTQIKVRGFRGFAQEQEFSFDQPVVILFGENHQGKSSTLNAVEWCLFGNECSGRKTGIRERVGWEIANRYAPEGNAAVTVVFSGPDGSYTITREQEDSRRRTSGTVTVVQPDGNTTRGEEAETELFRLFRSSFQDFMSSVYQHQEAIRAVITQDPKDRNEAIDRLVGLSQYREVLRGIDDAGLKKTQKAMESAFEDFRRRAEERIRTYDELVGEKKAKAVADGLQEQEMTEEEALRRAKEIGKAVDSLALELGITEPSVSIPQRFDEVDKFRDRMKTQINDLWARSPDVVKHETLAKEQHKLTSLSGKYQSARRTEISARQEKDAFVREQGDAPALENRAKEEQAKISDIDEQIGETNRRAILLREAIQYLQAEAPEADRQRCPLCATEVPDLLAHLEKEWEEKIKKEVDELLHQQEPHRTQLEHLESLKNELGGLEKKLEIARSDLESCTSEIGPVLERKIGDTDDPGSLLSVRLKEIASQLESTSQAMTQKRDRMATIEQDSGILSTLVEVLSHERKKETVEHIFESNEFATVDELRRQASRFVEDVMAIRASIAAASQEEAEVKMTTAGAVLDEYFCRTTKHPAIAGLTMEVAPDTRTGLNSYTLKSKDGKDPTPILSQGDLNCLALSLFLGLAQATGETQPFAFLMLDDPTQSLGSEMKQEFVRVLEDVANSRRLVIATQDPEFKELLIANLTKSKVVYNFRDWTQENGPVVSRTA